MAKIRLSESFDETLTVFRALRGRSFTATLFGAIAALDGAELDRSEEENLRATLKSFAGEWESGEMPPAGADESLAMAAYALHKRALPPREKPETYPDDPAFRFLCLYCLAGYLWRQAENAATGEEASRIHDDLLQVLHSTWSRKRGRAVNLTHGAVASVSHGVRFSENSPGGLRSGFVFLSSGFHFVRHHLLPIEGAQDPRTDDAVELAFSYGVAIHDLDALLEDASSLPDSLGRGLKGFLARTRPPENGARAFRLVRAY